VYRLGKTFTMAMWWSVCSVHARDIAQQDTGAQLYAEFKTLF